MSTPAEQRKARAVRATAAHTKAQNEGGALGGRIDPPLSLLPVAIAPPEISFYCYGLPVPQGSKAFAGFRNGPGGRKIPRLEEDQPTLVLWRDSVRKVMERVLAGMPAWTPINEAAVVSATFSLPRSAAATKRGDRYPLEPPDLDKLERALGDSISPQPVKDSDLGWVAGANAKAKARKQVLEQRRTKCILHDDSRIVGWVPFKRYAGEDYALKYPGVAVSVYLADNIIFPSQHAG